MISHCCQYLFAVKRVITTLLKIREVKFNVFAKSQLITAKSLHYLVQLIQMSTSCTPLGISNKVIVHQSSATYAKAGRSTQYSMKEKFRHDVIELFEKYEVNTERDRLDFIQSAENDILFQRKRKLEEQQTVIEDQLKCLSLPERSDLIKLLTHKPADEEINCLNEDMLAIFPTLRKKSVHLLNKKGRKEREDKIDLQFVDEFMHDHCR